MDLSSWVRRSFSRSSWKTQKNPDPIVLSDQENQPLVKQENEEESLGVTEELVDHIKSFTIDIFRNFPLQDDDDDEAAVNSYKDGSDVMSSSSANVRKDLSEWQERHAFHVLSKSKELSQLRFKLCPRYLKEWQFWRIYFKLVRNHVVKYELHAIERAKIRSMAMENEKASDNRGYEVEMAETRQAAKVEPSTRVQNS